MVRPALSPIAASPPAYQWDIYCWVIDNFGDAGVCLRLARDLVGLGHRVRLFINDADALDWLATDTDRALCGLGLLGPHGLDLPHFGPS